MSSSLRSALEETVKSFNQYLEDTCQTNMIDHKNAFLQRLITYLRRTNYFEDFSRISKPIKIFNLEIHDGVLRNITFLLPTFGRNNVLEALCEEVKYLDFSKLKSVREVKFTTIIEDIKNFKCDGRNHYSR